MVVELAPENNRPASQELSDFEPSMVTMDNLSTITELRINDGVVIEEPRLGQDVQQHVTINHAEEHSNNNYYHSNNNYYFGQPNSIYNLSDPHHSGTLMCPALSEAAQWQNFASAAALSHGSYGNWLRNMAGNYNGSEGNFTGSQNFPSLNPPPGFNTPLFNSAPQAPLNWVGTSTFGTEINHRKNDHGIKMQELIESFRNNQNSFAVPESNIQAPQRLPMPAYAQNSLVMENNTLNSNYMPDNNYSLQQSILPQAQSTIMTSSGLNLSNLSFTQLMSACDLMTCAFSEYWIKSQLTDNYEAQIVNNSVEMLANNNLFYNNNPNGSFNSSMNFSSSSATLYQADSQHMINHQAPATLPATQYPIMMPTQPIINPMERLNDTNNVNRSVIRRRRSTMNRPAILTRPRTSGVQTSVVSVASNSNIINNNSNSPGANPANPHTVAQAGGYNQSNGVGSYGRLDLVGRRMDKMGITLGSASRGRQEAPVESSASSSKRSRGGEFLARSEVLAALPAAERTENGPANFNATFSEANSNDVGDHSIASSNQPHEQMRNRNPNGLYDPEYERMGLPIDPFLRMFVLSNWNEKDNNKK